MTGTSDRQTGSLYEFASVTRFLQQDAASPDTLALRASLLSLSSQLEQATQTRREHHPIDSIERQAASLARQARQHQLQLTGMDSAWHGLYEFGAYQQAVLTLRKALEHWRQSLRQRSASEPQDFAEFERLAWRTLGEALLVLDLYEQQSGGRPASIPPSMPPVAAKPTLLGRLRAWMGL